MGAEDTEPKTKEVTRHQVTRYIRCAFRTTGAILCGLFAAFGIYLLVDDWSYATNLYTFSYWFCSSMGCTAIGLAGCLFEAFKGPQTALMCFAMAVFYFFTGCYVLGNVNSETSGETWEALLTTLGILMWIATVGRFCLAFVANSWLYECEEETQALV